MLIKSVDNKFANRFYANYRYNKFASNEKGMQYNFDEIIQRRGTACVKHDLLRQRFGTDDVTAMWVADMDFKAPDFVVEALRKRCNHEVFGYSFGDTSYYLAIQRWLLHHYSINADFSELHFIPGIVAGISFCLETFTQKGDKVLIMNPVYPPFINLPLGSGRQLSVSKLVYRNENYFIDFDDFAEKAKGCKLLILSNPHNPGGRIWEKEELQKIADICYENGVIVISDEIHADLTLPGYEHYSFASVSEKAKDISLTFIAPSKTFNIAGLGTSCVYVHNKSIRDEFFGYLDTFEVANGNVFAYIGAEAAFSPQGEEWLEQLKAYLAKNIEYTYNFFKKELPLAKLVVPHASYLFWIDFNDYKFTQAELTRRLVYDAKVALNSGPEFGADYTGFARMNVGCPMSILKNALDRIAVAINK
jgi:cystathionine beta-lyase